MPAPSQAERLGIVETKVENLNEKIDSLKIEVKEQNDELKDKLDKMYEASCIQHAELAKKISGLEKVREKVTWTVAGAVAFGGIVIGHLDKVVAFLK